MALKFKSNVTHNGILFKEGDVVADLSVANDLIERGLAEQTNDQVTHSSIMADGSGRATPVDPNSTPVQPTQAEIEAEEARRQAAIKTEEEARARTAAAQVASAQPGVLTPSEQLQQQSQQ